ncbi:hypothetical protein LPJ53_004460 [Coemansia erecta]|uniref:Threonyl/alanyl tRNA synthetase SAD domain-containing protein n=1 Tax=Coemansia erecta TaxID=147472 RepID=A0A9W7XUA8_9FUNG|nr:hypothetical protein LPJ53_004460 [Coemansia erecta]
MPTALAYFADTYQLEGPATVAAVLDAASPAAAAASSPALAALFAKHPHALTLDRTLFYPQGGGQPTDTGTITSPAGAFAVHHVAMHDGTVYHFGAGALPSPADTVELHVDSLTRLRNARCHSAGHLIFSLVTAQGSAWAMRERKGHHFADGAYVEFDGVMPAEEDVAAFQRRIDQAVAEDLPVHVYEGEDGRRYVRVGGYAENPCGGTHVRSTAELAGLTIRKIARRANQGTTKVSYAVEAK